MGELHSIEDGKVSKLKRTWGEGKLDQALIATAGMIRERDAMIERGDPQQSIDFVSEKIEENLAGRTDEEKRLVELTAEQMDQLKESHREEE